MCLSSQQAPAWVRDGCRGTCTAVMARPKTCLLTVSTAALFATYRNDQKWELCRIQGVEAYMCSNWSHLGSPELIFEWSVITSCHTNNSPARCLNVVGHHLLCGFHISKRENFGRRRTVHNSLPPSQERNHPEHLCVLVSQWEMGKSQKSRNLQLREGEKAQSINIGSLTVTLHVQVFCSISSSFWHLCWGGFCGQPPVFAKFFCFQTGCLFFSSKLQCCITFPFKYSHAYANPSFIQHNSKWVLFWVCKYINWFLSNMLL